MQMTGAGSDKLFSNLFQPSEFCSNFQQVRPAAYHTERVTFATEAMFGTQATVVVPHNGDLLTGATLECRLRKQPNEYPRSVGAYYPIEALVKRASVAVAGTAVDTHTNDFFRIYDEYVRTTEESQCYRRMANFDPDTLTTAVTCTETLYLPLVFSFFRSRKAPLPLAALQGTEVRLTFDFATAEEVGVDPSTMEAAVHLDYVSVDATARYQLSTQPITLLIEQLQWNGGQMVDQARPDFHVNLRSKLGFKRQVKALWWFLKETEAQDPDRTNHARFVGDWMGTYLSLQPSQNDFGGYNLLQSISEKLAPIRRARLLFDGRDRFPLRAGKMFNLNQPLKACSRAPLPGTYVYAFTDNIGQLQPSPGLCNFSGFKDVQLLVQMKKTVTADVTDAGVFSGPAAEDCAKNIDGLRSLHVYAWSYNMLRIFAGQAQVIVN